MARPLLLALVLLAAGCSGSDRIDVDKTYCPLATQPYRSAAELSQFRADVKEAFSERATYDANDRNRRIVTAARAVEAASRAYELRQKNPSLFTPGDDQGMAGAVAELKAACAVPKKKDS